MGAESPNQLTTAAGAVFLSYASQDALAAQRICASLRSAGIEVWFDQSELRGGDAWDQSIRKQIKSCALFLPIISKHTHERAEGYFRLEWKLAVDRSHLIMTNKAFLVPVVIDETPDDDENVPDKFREVQWTRLGAGETPPEFVRRIRQLLSGEAGLAPTVARKPPTVASGKHSRLKPAWLGVTVVLAAVAAYFLVEKPWIAKSTPLAKPAAPAETPVGFAPPPHSIAVLPFVNMSGDKEQEYFSDGVSEELINALSHIASLHVIARTSSFSFKGQQVEIGTIARKLNVAAILEGSIRRDRDKVRITVQLINTLNGFHIWSEDYDRDLKHMLSLQTEIATTVARELRARLLGDEATKIQSGGTKNPAAYDAYLRAEQLFPIADSETQWRSVAATFDEAINLDPDYAAAYAGRAVALIDILVATGSAEIRQTLRDRAQMSAKQAVALAPGYGYGHSALGFVRALGFFDFQGAAPEVERAIALDPGNARIQQFYATFNHWLGHAERAIAAQQLAVRLDPRSYRIRFNLALILHDARRYSEAQAALADAEAIKPEGKDIPVLRAEIMNALGRSDDARRFCGAATAMPEGDRHECLALAMHALGDLDAAERELAALRHMEGDARAFDYAGIYVQWGRTKDALTWLAVAERLRDPDLLDLRVSWRLDPLRNEPVFQALERRMNWPP